MKKIPSLFERVFNEDDTKEALNKVTPGCEWVIAGEGIATEKFDGTCCLVQKGQIYRRYDYKPGKILPEGAIPCQPERDSITQHWPHWVLCRENNKKADDKWYIQALNRKPDLEDGTYELVGPHFLGNPYNLEHDELWKHGSVILKDVPRTFEGIKGYLETHYIEGIVFHRDNGKMCKIKRTDFGFTWKGSKTKTTNNCLYTTSIITNTDGLSVNYVPISIIKNPVKELYTAEVQEAKKVLLEFVARDRAIRNNSNESDYDKFCEVTNTSIEKYIAYTQELEKIINEGVKHFENY